MAWLGLLFLKTMGWRVEGKIPNIKKFVIIAAPHTSNWDFLLGILFVTRHGIGLRWVGKDSLFRWPLKWFFLKLGGLPINRREPTGAIRKLADSFAQNEKLTICIAPEGTRAKGDHWRTGFYRLAQEATVPVGLGFFDYHRKCVGIERWVSLSGDEEADLALFRSYYADKAALYPEKAGDICFRDRKRNIPLGS